MFINRISVRSRLRSLGDGTRHGLMIASREFCFLARVLARPGDDKFRCFAFKFHTAARLGIDRGYAAFRIGQ
jgi:hypothetical protein